MPHVNKLGLKDVFLLIPKRNNLIALFMFGFKISKCKKATLLIEKEKTTIIICTRKKDSNECPKKLHSVSNISTMKKLVRRESTLMQK